MHVQYISDHRGKTTGVFIPIKEWEKLKKQYDLPQEDADEEPELTKEQLLADVKEALEEVKLYKQGKVKLQSARDFLKELNSEE
ncbi:hypothetical protein [Spirosoma gilvum]